MKEGILSQISLYEEKINPFHDDYKEKFPFESTIENTEMGIFQQIKLKNGQNIRFKLTFLKKTLDILPRSEQDPHFFSKEMKEAFPVLQDFWEELAKESECHLIQFQEPWYKKAFNKEEIKEAFTNKGYKYYTQPESMFLGEINLIERKAASFLKEIKKGVIPNVIVTSKVMQNLFEKAKKDEPTFVYKKRSETKYYYYYEGYEGYLSVTSKENQFYLVDEVLSYKEKIEDLVEKKGLSELFQKIEKKKRIENLFDPPMYHIKEKMHNYQTEKIQKIFSYLTNYYSPKEIEEYFAREEAYISPILSIKGGFRVLKLMEHYFVIEIYKNGFFKTADSKEKLKDILNQLLDILI